MTDDNRTIWDPTPQQIMQLTAPLNPARVKERKQGTGKISYLEAWDVKRMLVRIFGFGNFSADVIDSKVIKIIESDEPVMVWSNGKPTGPKIENGQPVMKHMYVVVTQCTVRLTIHATGATYTETAACSQKGPDLGEVVDFAIKTAESDALKRSAIYFGTQFGLSLYDDGSFADVVNLVMEPAQLMALESGRKGAAEKAAARQQQVADGQPVAPAQGDAAAPSQRRKAAPAEIPSDDEPEWIEPGEAAANYAQSNEEAGALDGKSALRQGFDRMA